MNYEEIISFDSLYEAAYKCRKNVSWKYSVQSFLLNDITNVSKLSRQLQDGTYKERPHRHFKVYEPKERDVMSLTFRDRIYQRSLNDNAVYPAMVRSLIRLNCACQHGKGTDFARKELILLLRKFWLKYHKRGYVLQIDLKKYYPSMDHNAVKACFKKYLPEDIYQPTLKILEMYDDEEGYGAGSQMIQIAGISLPNPVDHYIKEQLHQPFYIRYMDDSILFYETYEEAQKALELITEQYKKIGCTINSKKTKIYNMKHGITFLGFDFNLTKTGKVIQLLNKKKLRCKKIKYKKMAKLSNPDDPRIITGEKKIITLEKFNDCTISYMANASKGDSHNLVVELEKFFSDLREEISENERKINPKRGEIKTTMELNRWAAC